MKRRKLSDHPVDVIIFIGSDAWSEAQDPNQQSCKAPLVCPTDTRPEVFSWPVRGLPVLVIQFGDVQEMDILRLAYVLLKQHAAVVRFLGDDGLVVFDGSARNAS